MQAAFRFKYNLFNTFFSSLASIVFPRFSRCFALDGFGRSWCLKTSIEKISQNSSSLCKNFNKCLLQKVRRIVIVEVLSVEIKINLWQQNHFAKNNFSNKSLLRSESSWQLKKNRNVECCKSNKTWFQLLFYTLHMLHLKASKLERSSTRVKFLILFSQHTAFISWLKVVKN